MIDYEDLPNETQRSVRAAIENGSVLRDSDSFHGLDPREPQRVRYDGTTYVLVWDTMHVRAEYGRETFPREYRRYRHVEYRGALYEVTVVHGDVPQWELQVERVETSPEA